jgi:hypothetical protein
MLLEKIATNRMHPRSLLQTLTSGTIIGPLQLHGNKCIRNWWRILTEILHRLLPFLFHDTHISSPSVASHSTLLLYTRIQYLHRMIVFLIPGLKDEILLRSFQITHPSSHCNQGTRSTRRSSLPGPGSTAGVVKKWMICEFRPIYSPLWWFICIGPVALLEWLKFGWFESSSVALSYWCFASFLPAEMLLMNYICSRYFLNYGTETLEEDDAIMHWRYSFSYICTSRLILHGFCNWYCWTHVQGRHVPIYAHLQLRLATCRINQYHNCRPISTSRHIFIDNVFNLWKEKTYL